VQVSQVQQEAVGLLAAHPAVIADQLSSADGAVGVERAHDDKITATGKLGQALQLPDAQRQVAVGQQRVFAAHLAGAQVARAACRRRGARRCRRWR
jgi:hypothetical protein